MAIAVSAQVRFRYNFFGTCNILRSIKFPPILFFPCAVRGYSSPLGSNLFMLMFPTVNSLLVLHRRTARSPTHAEPDDKAVAAPAAVLGLVLAVPHCNHCCREDDGGGAGGEEGDGDCDRSVPAASAEPLPLGTSPATRGCRGRP